MKLRTAAMLVACLAAIHDAPAPAQDVPGIELPSEESASGDEAEASNLQAADEVELTSVPEDDAIATRLGEILSATGWFENTEISVDSGVVFLRGSTVQEEYSNWAGTLARNTEGVVAVVNELEVAAGSPWDLSPTIEQIRSLAATAFRSLPLLVLGFVLLALTWLVARFSLRGATHLLSVRVHSNLLRDVLARAVAALVFVLGVYVVLQVSGLTGLAVTIIGGTGLLGLAIGFAFRDIAENFLASILISIQRPFAMGDLIEVDGHTGYVQRVNTRATVIMTRDGNHVQVPNAIIYKNTITNFTANPRGREEFIVGIGYDDSIPEAQSVALEVLEAHPAVLDDPEPLVLVEELGPSTVNLRILFWINIAEYSHLKVRSAIIRLTKSAFETSGISMPDEAREVIFPAGVPIVREDNESTRPAPPRSRPKRDTSTAHEAEGDLANEADELERQASDARLPEGGANLL